MRIARVLLKSYRQFRDFDLDLTDPTTGVALSRVCFVGPNGTGKTTLLRVIAETIGNLREETYKHSDPVPPYLGLEIQAEQASFTILRPGGAVGSSYFSNEILRAPELPTVRTLETLPFQLSKLPIPTLDGAHDVIISIPPDRGSLLKQDPPSTNLSNAQGLFKSFPVMHEISAERAADFWNLLIYQIKKRESDYQAFQKLPENRKLTIEQAEKTFDAMHPAILPTIADLWNQLLGRAGLVFDPTAAKIPVQLSENLNAYVKVAATDAPLLYNDLSSGIRNFIFRIGHIAALYFERSIRRGLLLVDEPENSLYPDLLYDLVDTYQKITRNTQIFVATHSPIIAAQFKPEERIVLSFDEHAAVRARRGTSPEGDDPNDLLQHDFGAPLYGAVGLRQWERFLELRSKIRQARTVEEKNQFSDEYLSIGSAYNFPGFHAVPEKKH